MAFVEIKVRVLDFEGFALLRGSVVAEGEGAAVERVAVEDSLLTLLPLGAASSCAVR